MAVYKIFPIQDSTLYSQIPYMNAGLDPILEISNIVDIYGNNDVRRTLIKFDQEEITKIISNIPSSSFSAYLKLYNAEANNITRDFSIEVLPVYGDWSNGTGQAFDNPVVSNGVSWDSINGNDGNPWFLNNFPQNITASYSDYIPGGGNWYIENFNPNFNTSPTQSFNIRSTFDINTDVTDIVKLWCTSSLDNIPNNGLLLKLASPTEFNLSSSYQPQLNYYSIDTNTIYPPVLEIKWDDSIYNTGSLSSISNNDLVIGISNNKTIFYNDEINRFKINVRPKYPIRTYQTSSIYTSNYYLPTSSYYAVMDIDSGEYVIDFDEQYTKLSCNSNGNYFDLIMNGLEPERNYCILIKTIIEGNITIKGDKNIFRIKNG